MKEGKVGRKKKPENKQGELTEASACDAQTSNELFQL
jgi:hypothetical protein